VWFWGGGGGWFVGGGCVLSGVGNQKNPFPDQQQEPKSQVNSYLLPGLRPRRIRGHWIRFIEGGAERGFVLSLSVQPGGTDRGKDSRVFGSRGSRVCLPMGKSVSGSQREGGDSVRLRGKRSKKRSRLSRSGDSSVRKKKELLEIEENAFSRKKVRSEDRRDVHVRVRG